MKLIFVVVWNRRPRSRLSDSESHQAEKLQPEQLGDGVDNENELSGWISWCRMWSTKYEVHNSHATQSGTSGNTVWPLVAALLVGHQRQM